MFNELTREFKGIRIGSGHLESQIRPDTEPNQSKRIAEGRDGFVVPGGSAAG